MRFRKLQSQRGQVLPIVAICLTILLGFAALAVDAGYLQYKQRIQQTAADSAAIAGDWQLLNGKSPTTAGQTAASTNGFTDNGTTVKVSVTSPPSDGPNSSNKNAVEATVTASYPALFSVVLGRTQNAVTTRAVAILESSTSLPCIYILTKNFNVANGTVSGPCGVLVNNDVQANSKTVWNISSLGAGGHIISPPSTATTAVATGIPPVADPCNTTPGCKSLVAMYPLGSDVSKEGVYANTCVAPPAPGSTLGAGCYTSINGTYNLQAPGLYVIAGDLTGALTCTSCGTATGVTVVVGGKVNLNGSTTNLYSPPTTSDLSPTITQNSGAPGVVLYQASTSTAPENFSAQQLIGMVYAPDAHVNQNAGSNLTVTYFVVADFVSNGNFITLQYNSGESGNLAPRLAE
jgi:hypothetical protein